MSKAIEMLVSDAFGLERSEITEELTPDKVDGWDSMNHLKLISAIECEYGISLSMSEIQSMLSIGEIKTIVAAHSN